MAIELSLGAWAWFQTAYRLGPKLGTLLHTLYLKSCRERRNKQSAFLWFLACIATSAVVFSQELSRRRDPVSSSFLTEYDPCLLTIVRRQLSHPLHNISSALFLQYRSICKRIMTCDRDGARQNGGGGKLICPSALDPGNYSVQWHT